MNTEVCSSSLKYFLCYYFLNFI